MTEIFFRMTGSFFRMTGSFFRSGPVAPPCGQQFACNITALSYDSYNGNTQPGLGLAQDLLIVAREVLCRLR